MPRNLEWHIATALASLLLLCGPLLASDEEVIHDCDYWLLGKDDAEEAKLVAACDRIIKDKHFDRADRAMAMRSAPATPPRKVATTMPSPILIRL
jgi:hypothetical protein